MRNWLSAILATLCFGASALEAQSVPSPFEHIETRHSIGLFAGYIDIDSGDPALAPDPAPIFGARYGIGLAGPLLGEVSVGLIPSNRTIFARAGSGVPPDLNPVVETEALLIDVQAGFRFQITGPRTWHRLAPYLLLTGGLAANLTPSNTVEESLTSEQIYRFGPTFAATGGAGVSWFLGDRISLRAEAKDHFWRLTYPIGLTGLPDEETDWTHSPGVAIGTAFHF